MIKKLSNHIGNKSLLKTVDGLFTSKISYGVQLYGKVRLLNEDSKNGDLGAIQKVQNKMARFLNRKSLKDKVPTKTLLENLNMLSVNQINAKVKIQEIWKALHIKNYPLIVDCQSSSETSTSTRAMNRGDPKEIGNTILTSNSCVGDAIKVWNQTPNDIKKCESLSQLKKAARSYAKTLPT